MTKKQETELDKLILSIKELRESNLELRESQKKTDEQMDRTDQKLEKIFAEGRAEQKETTEQMKRTDEKLEKIFAEGRAEQKETTEQMKRTDEKLEKIFAEGRAEQKETTEQMKRTDEKLEKMGIHLGGISNNNGDMAEEFFYRGLEKKLNIANVKYDDIGRNWGKSRKGLQEEYDIILTNGKELGIVEVKYKVHHRDLQKLERKVKNFKRLFPIYSSFNINSAIAGMSVPDDIIEEAKEKGIHVLIAQGEYIEEKA